VSARSVPPFRADHVGSLLRPPELLAARADLAAGRITAADLRKAEDKAIASVVAMQEEVGLQSATDGEFRRASWHMDFIYQLGGISKAPGNLAVRFHSPAGDIEFTPAALQVSGKIGVEKTIFAGDFGYLQSVVKTATPKLTIPSPNMVHYRGGPASIDPAVYPDVEEFWHDLAAAYAEEIRRLGELGCTYLQLDDTSLAYLNDPAQRAEITGRGEDAEHLHLRYIKQVNAALTISGPRGPPRADTTSWRRRCSASWRWTGSSWNTTTSGPAASSRCGSCRRARWWCWDWSPPSAASWKTRISSSAASTRPPATSRSASWPSPASAASPPPSKATP
jgi:hypothetical protein